MFECELPLLKSLDYFRRYDFYPYRPISFDNRTALEELTRMADSGALGWPCVEALVACNRIGHPSPDRVIVSLDVRGTLPVGNCYGMVVDNETDSHSGFEIIITSGR